MSELLEKNQAQGRVCHVQEIAPIGGDHRDRVTVPVVSHSPTVLVLMDPSEERSPSVSKQQRMLWRWQCNLGLILFCPNQGETRKKSLMSVKQEGILPGSRKRWIR